MAFGLCVAFDLVERRRAALALSDKLAEMAEVFGKTVLDEILGAVGGQELGDGARCQFREAESGPRVTPVVV
jgi:hypothetical protein